MRLRVFASIVVSIVCGWSGFAAAQAGKGFDVEITNGRIVDGTGSPWYSGRANCGNWESEGCGAVEDDVLVNGFRWWLKGR